MPFRRKHVAAVASHGRDALAARAMSGNIIIAPTLEKAHQRPVTVRGFDDELDLSWWKDAFKVLKPPFAEDDGGDGDD